MVKLFFSYSHKDEALRDELEIHLTALKRQGIIDAWHDRRIGAGDEFDRSINEHLEEADIVLLLISPNFIASDYCYEVEMNRAMENHENGQSTVIPVILRPCDWHDLPFGKLLACPKDGKPISKFPDLDDGFLEVTKLVKEAVRKRKPSVSQKMQATGSRTHKINTPAASLVRSSNLRIKKSFTDHEKDKYLDDAFEYIANYFAGSLSELKERNPEVDFNYRRIDANSFSAAMYINGDEKSRCKIWLGEQGSFPEGIMYSNSGHGNSYNESLSVENDGYKMYLKPLGMSFRHQGQDEKLTLEGSAELFWSIFIEYLQ